MRRYQRRQAIHAFKADWKAEVRKWRYYEQVWRQVFFYPGDERSTKEEIVEAYGDRVFVDPFGSIHIARVSPFQYNYKGHWLTSIARCQYSISYLKRVSPRIIHRQRGDRMGSMRSPPMATKEPKKVMPVAITPKGQEVPTTRWSCCRLHSSDQLVPRRVEAQGRVRC